MSGLSVQAPRAVVLIRPHRFRPNPHTRDDNGFQEYDQRRTPEQVAAAAYAEATCLAERLTQAGVRVHLFEDETASTPDSVFPNNWFSTHSGGRVAVYPMYSPSRQRERRSDILEMLKAEYRVQEIIDYSGLERDRIYLEGTGAMVVDHIDRVVYAARSNRTSPVALMRFCAQFNYEPMLFDAMDPAGRPVYHTNVLMCIGTEFAMIGLSAITDLVRRAQVRRRLISQLQRFKDAYDANLPVQQAMPRFAAAYPGYDGTGLRELCQGIHDFYRAHDLARLTTDMYTSELVPQMLPADAWAQLTRGHVDRVPVDELKDRTTAVLLTPYPPGIPLLVPGERFNQAIISYLQFAEAFNQAYPGLETIIHGAESRTADNRSRLYVNCLREGRPCSSEP